MATDTTAVDTTPLARRAHKVLEPMHTLIYFVPEASEHLTAAGVTGGMRGYFASRSAPMGIVTPEVVIATFYNFSPTSVRKAIPSVWETSSPEAVLSARSAAADAALRRLLGDAADSAEMAEAAELARTATTACGIEGRPLFAGHASLPWPQAPHLQLWHAATLLREHRGDGHVAALTLAGLTGPEAVVSYCSLGVGMPEDLARKTRGYSEEEWEQTKAQLRDKGLMNPDGTLTDAGREQRDLVEAQTDAAAAAPYALLGDDRTRRLVELVRPWARSVTKQIFG